MTSLEMGSPAGVQASYLQLFRSEGVNKQCQRLLSFSLNNNRSYISSSLRITVFAASGSQDSFWEREESRWLREEQRWLREESRWKIERKGLLEKSVALMEEVQLLKRELQHLKRRNDEEDKKETVLSDLIVHVSGLLKSLNEIQGPRKSGILPDVSSSNTVISDAISSGIASSGTSIDAFATASTNTLQVASEISISEPLEYASKAELSSADKETKTVKVSLASRKDRRLLKRGSEGDDVKELQEALARIGFYSGEDDMEQSSFSSGTESAVKTWQATIGVIEDGIVTTKLLARLLGEDDVSLTEKESNVFFPSTVLEATASNVGTTIAETNGSVKRGTGHQEGLTKSSTSMEALEKRVYLLGENRWEDPDRLASKSGVRMKLAASERCFACKGEGQSLCTECEGTGELNVEEQFLEWAGEDAKCPYCEGSGSITCDVCDGTGLQTS